MKRASLVVAAVLIVIANSVALIHAWRNRSGKATSDLILTDRELPLVYSSEDDSAVGLTLSWRASNDTGIDSWLNVARLRALGFDTSVSPSSADAPEFYRRERPRRAFVALEYNGPAWEKARAFISKQVSNSRDGIVREPDWDKFSRLVVIDADLDSARLRTDHPDTAHVLIVPAVIGIAADRFDYLPEGHRPAPTLSGFIREIPSSVHVPLPFSEELRARVRRNGSVRYNVRLRYGASFEPWIVGFDFTPDDPAHLR